MTNADANHLVGFIPRAIHEIAATVHAGVGALLFKSGFVHGNPTGAMAFENAHRALYRSDPVKYGFLPARFKT